MIAKVIAIKCYYNSF